MITQTFHMQNKLQDIDPTVLSVMAAVEGRLGSDTRFNVEVCITEALTNLVLHACGGKSSPIRINLMLTHDRLCIEVFDPKGATPFDLRDFGPRLSQVDVLAESGRGLSLIKDCADTLEYGPVDGHHRLAMTFRTGVA